MASRSWTPTGWEPFGPFGGTLVLGIAVARVWSRYLPPAPERHSGSDFTRLLAVEAENQVLRLEAAALRRKAATRAFRGNISISPGAARGRSCHDTP